MRTHHRLARAALGFLAVLFGTAAEAGTPPIGAVVEGAMKVAGKQVPLPAGPWVLAGHALIPYGGGERIGAYGSIHNIVLLQVEQGRIGTVLELHVNALPVTDGWGISQDCSRTDLPLATIRYKAGWDGSCFFLAHTTARSKKEPEAWTAATRFAAGRGLAMAGEWLTAGFRVANRSDIVDARFHFAPESWGLPAGGKGTWADSPWSVSRLERDPQRLAVARTLTEWGVRFSGLVEAGIKNRVDPAAPLPLPTARAKDARDVIEQRVAAVDDLLRSGAIDARQHRIQIARLLERGLDPGSEVTDPSTVALYKTLSYRPMVSFANVWIDYYWIGQPWAAGLLVLLQVTVNTTKFYFHELAWEQIAGGGTRRDSARTMDFAYLGTNR